MKTEYKMTIKGGTSTYIPDRRYDSLDEANKIFDSLMDTKGRSSGKYVMTLSEIKFEETLLREGELLPDEVSIEEREEARAQLCKMGLIEE